MLRRSLATLLALLVLLEGAGVARALSVGGDLDCCCGVHSLLRRCSCKDCPVAMRGVRAVDGDRLSARRECAGSPEATVLAVSATAPPPPPSLAAPSPTATLAWPPSRPPAGLLLEAGRPPP